ncbi:MAG: BrnA antitoxin family protein [Lentilitoribacter sp.]
MSEKLTDNTSRTTSLDEIRQVKNAGKLKPVKNTAAASEELPEGFWDDAEIVEPKAKTAISLRVDADVLDYFKSQGKGHLTRMNAVLRSYVEAQRSR